MRLRCALAAGATLATGLALQLLERTPLVDLAGGALYTLLVGLLLAFLAPAWPALRLATVAYGMSAAIELLQLTGLPQALVEAAPPLRLVLGSSFDPLDLLAYAVGAAAVWAVRAFIGRPAAVDAQEPGA